MYADTAILKGEVVEGSGTAITELPFEPRDTSNLKCLDCFKKSK